MDENERVGILETKVEHAEEDIKRHAIHIGGLLTFMNETKIILNNLHDDILPRMERNNARSLRFNNWLTATVLAILVGKILEELFLKR